MEGGSYSVDMDSVGNGIDRLPTDVVIHILSFLTLKEAARTSVLARRWRHWWLFAQKTLRFEHRDSVTGAVMGGERFESWVNTILGLHQGRGAIEGIIISFDVQADRYAIGHSTSRAVDRWVHFAMQKKLQTLVLNLSEDSRYTFPNYGPKARTSSSSSSSSNSSSSSSSPPSPSPWGLKTLRLGNVDIRDSVVHYFVASCPDIEDLCIRSSYRTEQLRFMDPPRLRVLEVRRCFNIQSLEISAASLVSLAFEGKEEKSLVLKKVPNLRELTLSGDLGLLFVINPKSNRSYSSQLEKLVLDFRFLDIDVRPVVVCPDLPKLCSLKRLELQVYKAPDQSLLFFKSLIEASPQLCEFRVELSYPLYPASLNDGRRVLPSIRNREAVKYVHKKIKVVEVAGFIGLPTEKQLIFVLYKTYRSIKTMVIDTESNYYDHPQPGCRLSRLGVFNDCTPGVGATTRNKARKDANDFVAKFVRSIKTIVT